jgi:hypothetical protein
MPTLLHCRQLLSNGARKHLEQQQWLAWDNHITACAQSGHLPSLPRSEPGNAHDTDCSKLLKNFLYCIGDDPSRQQRLKAYVGYLWYSNQLYIEGIVQGIATCATVDRVGEFSSESEMTKRLRVPLWAYVYHLVAIGDLHGNSERNIPQEI